MPDEQCILIHGFAGSPLELEPLANALSEAGYQIRSPILHGHGGGKDDLKRSTATSWVSSVQSIVAEAAKHGPVHLIGFSMGAMIASILAQRIQVSSVTMLAPAVYYANSKQMFEGMAKHIKETWNVAGMRREVAKARLEAVAETPIQSYRQFRRLVLMAKPTLVNLRAPLCVIQGEQDEVVEPRSATYVYNAARSEIKEIHYLAQSGHILCLGPESSQLNQLVLRFLQRLGHPPAV